MRQWCTAASSCLDSFATRELAHGGFAFARVLQTTIDEKQQRRKKTLLFQVDLDQHSRKFAKKWCSELLLRCRSDNWMTTTASDTSSSSCTSVSHMNHSDLNSQAVAVSLQTLGLFASYQVFVPQSESSSTRPGGSTRTDSHDVGDEQNLRVAPSTSAAVKELSLLLAEKFFLANSDTKEDPLGPTHFIGALHALSRLSFAEFLSPEKSGEFALRWIAAYLGRESEKFSLQNLSNAGYGIGRLLSTSRFGGIPSHDVQETRRSGSSATSGKNLLSVANHPLQQQPILQPEFLIREFLAKWQREVAEKNLNPLNIRDLTNMMAGVGKCAEILHTFTSMGANKEGGCPSGAASDDCPLEGVEDILEDDHAPAQMKEVDARESQQSCSRLLRKTMKLSGRGVLRPPTTTKPKPLLDPDFLKNWRTTATEKISSFTPQALAHSLSGLASSVCEDVSSTEDDYDGAKATTSGGTRSCSAIGEEAAGVLSSSSSSSSPNNKDIVAEIQTYLSDWHSQLLKTKHTFNDQAVNVSLVAILKFLQGASSTTHQQSSDVDIHPPPPSQVLHEAVWTHAYRPLEAVVTEKLTSQDPKVLTDRGLLQILHNVSKVQERRTQLGLLAKCSSADALPFFEAWEGCAAAYIGRKTSDTDSAHSSCGRNSRSRSSGMSPEWLGSVMRPYVRLLDQIPPEELRVSSRKVFHNGPFLPAWSHAWKQTQNTENIKPASTSSARYRSSTTANALSPRAMLCAVWSVARLLGHPSLIQRVQSVSDFVSELYGEEMKNEASSSTAAAADSEMNYHDLCESNTRRSSPELQARADNPQSSREDHHDELSSTSQQAHDHLPAAPAPAQHDNSAIPAFWSADDLVADFLPAWVSFLEEYRKQQKTIPTKYLVALLFSLKRLAVFQTNKARRTSLFFATGERRIEKQFPSPLTSEAFLQSNLLNLVRFSQLRSGNLAVLVQSVAELECSLGGNAAFWSRVIERALQLKFNSLEIGTVVLAFARTLDRCECDFGS
ncbi:unnamed protein product [Amoebophrya sp. A120]|nr:unnamed protein product [Amoebophrya sp. A120]|eukprot:GSA120T00022506001.1